MERRTPKPTRNGGDPKVHYKRGGGTPKPIINEGRNPKAHYKLGGGTPKPTRNGEMDPKSLQKREGTPKPL